MLLNDENDRFGTPKLNGSVSEFGGYSMPARPDTFAPFSKLFADEDFACVNWIEKVCTVRPWLMFREIGAAMLVLCEVPPSIGIALNVWLLLWRYCNCALSTMLRPRPPRPPPPRPPPPPPPPRKPPVGTVGERFWMSLRLTALEVASVMPSAFRLSMSLD